MKYPYFFGCNWRTSAALLFAGACAFQLSGCNGIELPPVDLDVLVVPDAGIVAADQTSGSIDVPIGAFCDLFSEAQLNQLLTDAGAGDLANLIDLDRVELEYIVVTATQGNFNGFTSASLDMTLLDVGAAPIDLGSISNSGGLGDSFELMVDPPFDLLNGLNNNQCGIPALHLTGTSAPTNDIQFEVVAHVKLYAKANIGA